MAEPIHEWDNKDLEELNKTLTKIASALQGLQNSDTLNSRDLIELIAEKVSKIAEM